MRAAPAIMLVSEASFRSGGGHLLLKALVEIARAAAVPACVQLDHVSERGLIRAAFDAGAGAVMADGSRLPMDENEALVRAVATDVAGRDIGVEAELGHIEGDEDAATAVAAGALTDPDEAARFVAATSCDCLAVSIGNVHGRYLAPPSLDWERLRRIRALVDVPLSLHGASGLPEDDVRRALSLGVSKVNVNTEIRQRYLGELEAQLPAVLQGLRLLDLQERLVAAVADIVGAKLDLLAGG
jgi:tagatose 1,6-diphosphate aldolase GatY/KbaY